MYVTMIAAECAPVAKAGGLGDVVAGLARELALRHHAVEIVLPRYAAMSLGDVWGLTVSFDDLWVPWGGSAVHCTVFFGFVHGHKCFFIEPHSPEDFFGRDRLYAYVDDVERFAFFSKAALEFLVQAGKRPEIVHCHDWQTSLVPVLLYEQYHDALADQRVCLTVHNFRHQGRTDEHLLERAGFSDVERLLSDERLGDDAVYRGVNLLKGGIVYANFVTTVSPGHAGEARSNGGFGLERTLSIHHEKFGGVLNGVDYDTWNPEIDERIPARYSLDDLEPKYEDKRALRERLWLRHTWSPIVAYLGRLDEQKGMHLVHHALFYALERGAQFVLVGDAHYHEGISRHFDQLKAHLDDNPDCHLELAYDETLAHLVYAGADLVVVPSIFEPCGLVPLVAMRYGTVPVVRAVGGMADSVHDRDQATGPGQEPNGYTFCEASEAGLESALSRSLGLWFDYPDEFRRLARNAMRAEHSWARPGQDYCNIYEHIRHR